MRELFKQIKTDKIIKWGVYTSSGLLFIQFIYLFFSFSFLPPFIPLFHQLVWGEDRLGTKIEIFLPFLITLAFLVINLILSTQFYDKMPLISRMLSITSLLITLISFIFIVRTTQLIL